MIEDIRYSKVNWLALLAMVLIMIGLLLYFDHAWAAEPDAKATELAQKSMDAMGGMAGWKQVHAIRFNFQVERKGAEPKFVKHLWDRTANRDHVEGNSDGKATVAWVNLTTHEGKAWQDGKELQGDDLKKAMDWAYGRWVNDTYWLIMPLKMKDSGVNLTYDGEKEGHDVLHLSFGKVGLTPGDQYWAYLNKTSGLMDSWEFLLQDGSKGKFEWQQWDQYGPVKLSSIKVDPDGTAIHFTPLKVLDSADAGYFGDEMKTLAD